MAQITLGGKPINTIGELPAVGSKAPNFTAIKPDFTPVSLEELRGKKVILNIFPSIDTGVCAASVRKFNQEAANFENTAVVCLSVDLPFAQKRFCGAEGIDNVIVASNYRDGGSFGEAYGVIATNGAFGGLHSRAIVVVDEEGLVTYTEQVPEIGQEPDYEKALAVI
ncbi:MAG: thiol peroxidase [Cytophagales bacterium]|nr:thiol peroxidase [Cytophagales bacterium]